MYSLFIDTHDSWVTIVLFKDGKVLEIKKEQSTNNHSVITMPMIDDVFKANKLDIKDLNEVLVVNGPGSFTGVRIAVTIAKTIAFCLKVPIKVIDALTIQAINIRSEKKYVSIPDKNGAFVGIFDKENNPINSFKYYNLSNYNELCNKYDFVSDVDIDYEKVYEYFKSLKSVNPHIVKPLYIKEISVLNDK